LDFYGSTLFMDYGTCERIVGGGGVSLYCCWNVGVGKLFMHDRSRRPEHLGSIGRRGLTVKDKLLCFSFSGFSMFDLSIFPNFVWAEAESLLTFKKGLCSFHIYPLTF
jgi:hypothetical protein